MNLAALSDILHDILAKYLSIPAATGGAMQKVVLEGHITVPATDWAAVASELSNHIELTRSEAGCLVFEVHPDGNTPGLYHVYEDFTDQCAFRAHQDRVSSSAWGEVTKNVQRHYDIRECES